MLYELPDATLLWAALMLAGGLATLLWLVADWLLRPDTPPRPAAPAYLVPGRRLAPGDPDNGLRPVPVAPGHGSRLVTDDEFAEFERWLRCQEPL